MGGHGGHEPWGDEPRRRQLRRVVLGLGAVVVLAVVVLLVVQRLG